LPDSGQGPVRREGGGGELGQVGDGLAATNVGRVDAFGLQRFSCTECVSQIYINEAR